ncbi:ABC transporter permease [Cohnella panacarvi]|uniref:ABC transporter permease n=1 Tax=Cohnella panacarvi TaxID=400776 RepID=UPI00047C11BB|nr:ABC transporter permease subunit [Cohnella panacarvi]
MNKTLLTGLTITVLMILATLFGRYLSPHGVDEQMKIHYVAEENTVVAPPAAPGSEYPLGTDKQGFDMLAKMLDGAKYTILLSVSIAFVRVLVGGIIGLILGYYGKKKGRSTGQFSVWSLLNGIPVFIIAWMIMVGISMNPSVSPAYLASLLAVVLAIIGIPSVAVTIQEKAMVVREKQFVLSAKALGASPWAIVRRHIYPSMKENVVILFVQEAVLVLGLFGQLAIFNIFVGGTIRYLDPFLPPIYMSRSNEWSGLIGQARNMFYVYQWILLVPLIGYVLYIVGFHLISVGLEKQYKKKYAKFAQI